MRKLNLYEVYSAAKELSAIRNLPRDGKITYYVFPLWDARERLKQMIASGLLLSSSSRAAQVLIQQIGMTLPDEIDKAINIDETQVFDWRASAISGKVTELETVLGNDMPDIASYVVSQKGIYRTADLIEHAEKQLSEAGQKAISEQTCRDVRDAGRALAYELATACAFHLWRSVESCMGTYYERLTGNDWGTAGIVRNWGAYIKAMAAAGAPSKITGFLDHIRAEYRNPQTHPDELVPLDEAQRLFPVALSAIEQLALETEKLPRLLTPQSAVMALASVAAPSLIATTAPKP
jgi:hypothetical protein